MTSAIATVPARSGAVRWPTAVLAGTGHLALLGFAILRVLVHPQVWAIGTLIEIRRQLADAALLVLLLAGLGGALIAQQTGYQFQGTLPPWIVGSVVAASVITELAPLFTGFAIVGTIGTRMAAEIASMQSTQQIDALEVMGRDPAVHLVAPRVLAATVTGPVLMCFALVAAMLSGWVVALLTTRASTSDFWFGVRHYMRDFPLFYALIKGVVFGAATSFAACHAGLGTHGGSAGVGQSVRRAVIRMITIVIFLDTALVPLLKVIRT